MKRAEKTDYIKAVLCAALLITGCAECDGDFCDDGMDNYGVNPEYTVNRLPLAAQCSISVQGYGTVDMETDYVPNTTWCENGGAGPQALRAQAAAARTFAYYKLSTGAGIPSKPVNNSQGDQVYKCESRAPSAAQLQKCKDAASDTSGYVMTYQGTVTAGFYVSGSKPDYLNAECVFTGNSSSAGWVSQQAYVTYNWGKSGSGLTQTSLGWVNPGNKANRGCMSQYGARCLSDKGWEWQNILKFFYGADINIEKAVGSCVTETIVPKCEKTLNASGVIIDEKDPCFSKSNSNAWYETNAGYENHLYFTYVWEQAAETIGTWTVNVTRPGTYDVQAYIQTGVGAVSEKAPYTVRASGKEKRVAVNLNGKSGWVSLGKFDFAKGGDQWVKLSDDSGEAYIDKNGKRVIFDAIRFVDAVTCTNVCVENAKQCSGNGVQTCVKNASSGCTEWSAAKACGANQSCSGGACQDNAPACKDACTEGKKQCSGNGVQTCTRNSASGCTEWLAPVPCSDNQVCTEDACVDKSQECPADACTAGEKKCSGSTGTVTCIVDDKGCSYWGSELTSCDSGEVCVGAECIKKSEAWDGENENMPKECMTFIDGRASTIIDDLDACFKRSQSSHWSVLRDLGYGGHLYYAYVRDDMPSAVGTWYMNCTKTGKYSIYAYIDSGIGSVSNRAPYTIKAGDSKVSFAVDLDGKSGWFSLGDYELTAGELQYVQLMDASGEVYKSNNGKRLVFDAIQVVPYGTAIDGEAEGKPAPDDSNDGQETDDSSESHVSSDCSGSPIPSQSHAPWLLLGAAALLGFSRRSRMRR